MTASLATLRDDDVDARVAVALRLCRRAAQRGDLASALLDLLDDVGWRRPESVGDEGDAVVVERHLHLWGGSGVGPSEQP